MSQLLQERQQSQAVEANLRIQRSTELSLKAAMGVLMIGQRLAIPLGEYQIPLIVPVLFFLLFMWIRQRNVIMMPERIVMYLWFAGLSLLSLLVQSIGRWDHSLSLQSLSYFFILYLPFIFVMRDDGRLFQTTLRTYQGITLGASVAAILQFSLQLTGWTYVDPMRAFLPESLLQRGFNLAPPIHFGSELIKSNGVIFLEPSFLSKHVAMALVIEALFFRRTRWIAAYTGALLTSFSGTGVLLLAVLFVSVLAQLRGYGRLMLLGLLTLAALAFYFTGYGTVFLERTTEFQNPAASGYVRFVAPYLAFGEFLQSSTVLDILFGLGAGALENTEGAVGGMAYSFSRSEGYLWAHPATFVKVFMEHGLITGTAFAAFILLVFFSRSRSGIIAGGLFLVYSVLTGALLQAQTLYWCYLLGPLFTRTAGAQKRIGKWINASRLH